MNRFVIQFVLLLQLTTGFSQIKPGDDVLRGPQNMLPGGVIDGVVYKDDHLPLRKAVEYEPIRLADLAWSKRVWSRIDAREKMNHPLFYPFDEINQTEFKFPKNRREVDTNRSWLRHQERLSLWTIIERHIILGDLTVYRVYAPENPSIEDGDQLKYPIEKKGRDDFFNNQKYRQSIIECLAVGSRGADWLVDNPIDIAQGILNSPVPVMKSGTVINGTVPEFKTFTQWFEYIMNSKKFSDRNIDPQFSIFFGQLDSTDDLKNAWKEAEYGGILKKPPVVTYITSRVITAYNIKEDWFFDKERSILDKRIIAIAPVARMKYDRDGAQKAEESSQPFELERYSSVLNVNPKGVIGDYEKNKTGVITFKPFEPSESKYIVERELFWLYFPHLRNVIINYYVYNDKNDAQWMSFDDFFMKRLYSAQIYKASEKFDQDINDVRTGVDALLKAQEIRETIRNWESDIWNY